MALVLALSLALVASVALLAFRERGAARKAEAETSRLRSEIELERDYTRTVLERAEVEREKLYQRIQAPEAAVHDAQLEARRERPYERRQPIGADDDAAFNGRGSTTETAE